MKALIFQKSASAYEKERGIYAPTRVLLVDDMEANRVIFQELAAPWKFILDLAVSGEEAVQMVKEREYQMIILDQMMPGMSGSHPADCLF